MADFGFQEMQEIQRQLQEKYKDKWNPLSPEQGKDQLMWMMIEVGEAADIMKKEGAHASVRGSETIFDSSFCACSHPARLSVAYPTVYSSLHSLSKCSVQENKAAPAHLSPVHGFIIPHFYPIEKP